MYPEQVAGSSRPVVSWGDLHRGGEQREHAPEPIATAVGSEGEEWRLYRRTWRLVHSVLPHTHTHTHTHCPPPKHTHTCPTPHTHTYVLPPPPPPPPTHTHTPAASLQKLCSGPGIDQHIREQEHHPLLGPPSAQLQGEGGNTPRAASALSSLPHPPRGESLLTFMSLSSRMNHLPGAMMGGAPCRWLCMSSIFCEFS